MASNSSGWDGWVAGAFAAVAAIIGSFVGVRVASVEGDNAIQLETKKFELGLIKEALSMNEDPHQALNQLNFLIDIGLIETIDRDTINTIAIEQLPTFRESRRTEVRNDRGPGLLEGRSTMLNQADIKGTSTDSQAQADPENDGEQSPGPGLLALPEPRQQYWNLLEAWLNLHNAADVWDLQTASDSLAILIRSSNKCVKKYASDVQVELKDLGVDGFSLMADIRSYYNNEGGCTLSENNFTIDDSPSMVSGAVGADEDGANGGTGPVSVPSPSDPMNGPEDIDLIPPFRGRN
jgi:hypothetical protein